MVYKIKHWNILGYFYMYGWQSVEVLLALRMLGGRQQHPGDANNTSTTKSSSIELHKLLIT